MKKIKVNYLKFLYDVFVCSLSTYGGPEAHYGIFSQQLVEKKKYLTEKELAELIALTTILPGPSSTQTLIAIGYKIGGGLLAFLTMLVWILPILIIMTFLSFIVGVAGIFGFNKDIFSYIAPMAIGFILIALLNISKKSITNIRGVCLFISSAIVSYLVGTVWIAPLLLFLGGFIAILLTKEENIFNKVKVKIHWRYFIIFLAFAVGLVLLNLIWDNKVLYLFESFYRYGYLVIGGGQVVVPLIYNDIVNVANYMTSDEFLLGYGLVQALPGPMFGFASYVGGMATRDLGIFSQVFGGMLAGMAIFLPGILLIFFIYPIWAQIREIKAIKIAINGIIPVACGLLLSSSLSMLMKLDITIINVIVILFTVGVLFKKLIPTPLLVILVIVLGVVI